MNIDEAEKSLLNEEKFSEATKNFNLWEKRFHLKFVHMDDNLKFHYADHTVADCIPFVFKIENIAATITRGHHLKRQIYIEPFAIGQASSLYNIHSHLMGVANEKFKEKKRKNNKFSRFRFTLLKCWTCTYK